ncbi:LysR family transcriptional regulator [Clostridium botulinum]|uniref:LysR family transcriptional regulator n=1 Tax=Clostridium botulinum TaxID=1491 RepID=UPI00174DC5FD|nr:LysR family transcriptional regulator [Clostridium botulinum]MBD5643025.1 LysR family transcriptional regulator [Clostridium botulinum]
MNFEYLQSFYITVKCNSISKAAEALHLTQPGLSMQLKNLEKEIGADLLIRSNKGVRPTEEGKIIYNYADTILSMKDNIERDIKNIKKTRPKLIISSCKSVGEYALPCSIYIFKKFNKEVDIDMEILNSTEVMEKLCDHSSNIGIIQDLPKDKSIDAKLITSDELILVGNNKYNKDNITLEELKNLPLILREKTSSATYLVKKALSQKGVSIEDLNIVYNLNSPEAIKSSICAGKGFAFLPKLTVKKELKKESIKHINLENIDIKFNYYVIFRKNYVFTKCEKMFVDFIISRKRGFC